MNTEEKQGRLETAAALLEVLKGLGCPASEVSREVGVSTTTISYWRAVDSAKGRSVSIPSDANLNRLVEVMRSKLIENLYSNTSSPIGNLTVVASVKSHKQTALDQSKSLKQTVVCPLESYKQIVADPLRSYEQTVVGQLGTNKKTVLELFKSYYISKT